MWYCLLPLYSVDDLASTGLYATCLEGQGHQYIFFLGIKDTLQGNCKFSAWAFSGQQGSYQGAWRQSPSLPPWINADHTGRPCYQSYPIGPSSSLHISFVYKTLIILCETDILSRTWAIMDCYFCSVQAMKEVWLFLLNNTWFLKPLIEFRY